MTVFTQILFHFGGQLFNAIKEIMNSKLTVTLSLISILFCSDLHANTGDMTFDSLVDRFELVAKHGKTCARIQQKNSVECREFMSYLKADFKKDSIEFNSKFSEFITLDLEKALRGSNAIVEISDVFFSTAIKNHNNKIN